MEQESDRHFSALATATLLIASTVTVGWVGLVGWSLIKVATFWLHY
jgi:hypothetical protein